MKFSNKFSCSAKAILTISFITAVSLTLSSQDNHRVNLEFRTQGSIDSFPEQHKGLSIILGSVLISEGEGHEITNLDSLSQLTLIKGDLTIFRNNSLLSLKGLDNIAEVNGSIQIQICNGLSDLKGLGGMKTVVGELRIEKNSSLVSLTGLEQLSTVGNDLNISYNNELINLNGLENLKVIKRKLIIKDNEKLKSLDAMNASLYVGKGKDVFDNNSLEDFGPFVEKYGNNEVEKAKGTYRMTVSLTNESINYTKGYLLDTEENELIFSPTQYSKSEQRIAIDKVESIKFTKVSNKLKGPFIAGVIGFSVGAFIGYKQGDSPGKVVPSWFFNLPQYVEGRSKWEKAGTGGLIGGALGALIGLAASSTSIKIPIGGKKANFKKNERKIRKYILDL